MRDLVRNIIPLSFGAIGIVGTVASIAALQPGLTRALLLLICFGCLLLAIVVGFSSSSRDPFPAMNGHYSSHFASTLDQLDVVLKLRKAYFGRRIIAPDHTYGACWALNRYSMKIVYHPNGKPVGYWSTIPVDDHTFQEFINGRLSHSEMLTKCLDWSSVDPGNVFLYLVGAVVPGNSMPVNNLIKRRGVGHLLGSWVDFGLYLIDRSTGLLDQRRRQFAGRVMLDWISFGDKILDRCTVNGICGYPSRIAGHKQFVAHYFRQTKVLIDGDENEPIFVLSEDGIGRLKKTLKTRLKRKSKLPRWDEEDEQHFLVRLPPIGKSK